MIRSAKGCEDVVSIDRPTVLIVEDDPALRNMLGQALGGMDVRLAADLTSAEALLEPLPDVVLTDVHLAGEDGVAFARSLHERHPRLPVVVMTAFGDLKIAVEALRAGAYDFLTKPLDLAVLRQALRRAAETHRLRREVRELRRQVRSVQAIDGLVGESPPMRALLAMLTRVAAAPSSVLIRGESGTGKELVARALHQLSPRAARPFIALNCAALAENLLESELFGHVRGAFTDAVANRPGLFVQAEGGTLFLDEIGDMPASLQSKLLRVLQERRVRPVGGEREIGIDVRVVAATHKDLEQLVADGLFREDLLYRLDVIRLDLPPLRERGADVLLLAQRFVGDFAARLGKPVRGISPEAAVKILDHPWPGNVRELQNCMERAVVLCAYDDVQLDDLPTKVRAAEPVRHQGAGATEPRPTAPTAPIPSPLLPLDEVERRHVLRVLEAVGGRRSEAADVLEIDRKTLYRKLERWKVDSGES